MEQYEIDKLLAAMRRETRRQRRWRLINTFPILWMLVSGLVFAALSAVIFSVWKFDIGCWIWIVCISSTSNGTLKCLNSKSRRKTVAALVQAEDVRVVGALCDVLAFQDEKMQGLAEEALVNLLPRLQASDSSLLNAEQRRYLYAALRGNNRALILAILKALEQVGDDKALPFVKALSERKYPAAADLAVERAAAECLPFLKLRAEQERLSSTLLRPSSLGRDPAILLRPAASVAETAPEQLLRAAGREEA